jgi:hypothetical protein
MQIPATVIGFGLVVVGSAILRPLRARYLEQASKKISIDASKEIKLRYAIWYYIYPFLGFGGAILMGWATIHTKIPEAIFIYRIACVACFLGGIYLFYRQWTGRVTILDGTLTYKEGSDRSVIHAKDVLGFSSKGFIFLVQLKSEDIVKIPATFEHSEIILAFLNQAVFNK